MAELSKREVKKLIITQQIMLAAIKVSIYKDPIDFEHISEFIMSALEDADKEDKNG